jgi:hypothetical protein
MRYGQAASGILILAIGLIAMLVMFPDIISLNETARTQAAQDVGLGCTSDTLGKCTLTISSAHEYSTNTFMTVTETAPGSVDRTAGTTVQVNRTSLDLTGLSTTPTVYTFTVDYTERNALVSEGANEFLSRLPLILVLGLLGVGVGGSIAAWSMIRGGSRVHRRRI